MSVRIIFLLTGLIAVLLNFHNIHAQEQQNQKKSFHENYAIFSIKHPEELYFSGERVPLENIDVKESLDRELHVNTYWQSQTMLFIKKANKYFPVIEPILEKYGVPEDFKYITLAESGLENVVSPARAVGFWQLLEGTARDYGLEVNKEVDERYHFEKATEAASKYIIDSYKKYNDWTIVAASYNVGRRGIDRQIERQKENNYYDLLLNSETARYIYRILAIKLIIENPAEYGFYYDKEDLYFQIPHYEVKIDSAVPSFADFAKSYGTNYKILKRLNPWLRESYLTNKNRKTYVIKIPIEGGRTYSAPKEVELEEIK